MPTLAAFYGGDPDAWLRLPLGWLRAFARMLPRLEAQRALLAAEVAMAGDAWLDAKLRRRILDGWRRAAGGGQEAGGRSRAAGVRLTPEEFERRLAGLGLAVG